MSNLSIHRQIVDDYAAYIRSFVTIAEEELRRRVERHLTEGYLRPQPILALDPSFTTVSRVEALTESGSFTPQVADAFRRS